MFSANAKLIAIVLVLLFIGLFLTACEKIKSSETKTVGVNARVEKLFEHEGCTVYRFEDAGYKRYYTKCVNSTSSSASWSESCGKSCKNHQITPTSYERNRSSESSF